MKSDTNLWVKEMRKRHGWHIDRDLNNPDFPYDANIHTHGLIQFGHLDLQVCYPLNAEDAYILMMVAVERIRAGVTFTPGIKYGDMLCGCDVEFAEAKEDGRVVLRMILPDSTGNLHGDLKEQWKGCRVYHINN